MNYRIYLILFVLIIGARTECVTVTSLDPVGTPTTIGTGVLTVDWCGCEFFAAGGRDAAANGFIQVYSFNQTTSMLERVGTTTTLGTFVNGLEWCEDCRFLAVGGEDASDGLVQTYSFDPTNPSNLERVGMTTMIGVRVLTLDWCSDCRFLAVGGDAPGFIQIYSFDPTNPGDLVPVGATYFATGSVRSIKWCGDCHYLAAAGNGFVSIFSFDPDNPGDLLLEFDLTTDKINRAIDWCGEDCNYLAVGGQGSDFLGFIDIYSFNPQGAPILSLVESITIAPTESDVFSVAWCTCNTIAASGSIGSDGIVQLYNFDEIMTLSLKQSFNIGIIMLSVDWCRNCDYLAAGGTTLGADGIIQLYKSTKAPGINAVSNLRAQKLCHRFPTQMDIINTICWNAVTTAVSYNVYADENLSALLATITTAPFCYSQHQICRGRSSTYFVTAVDAEGNESEASSVTI